MNLAPKTIAGTGVVVVWAEAFRLLASEHCRFNLVLHVRSPLEQVRDQITALDPRRVHTTARSLFDVATTIFPARCSRWDLSVRDFTAHYRVAYERMLSRGSRSWGCYFLRLVEFGDAKINQLDRVITGLSTWGSRHKAAFTVHFSSSATDKPRPQGAPCLQYVQFSVGDDGLLSLTAVYRSHDYFYKTLGNLVGLSRLLEFVAIKSGHQVGTLTCLSTYAFVDATRSRVRALLGRADAYRIAN